MFLLHLLLMTCKVQAVQLLREDMFVLNPFCAVITQHAAKIQVAASFFFFF